MKIKSVDVLMIDVGHVDVTWFYAWDSVWVSLYHDFLVVFGWLVNMVRRSRGLWKYWQKCSPFSVLKLKEPQLCLLRAVLSWSQNSGVHFSKSIRFAKTKKKNYHSKDVQPSKHPSVVRFSYWFLISHCSLGLWKSRSLPRVFESCYLL